MSIYIYIYFYIYLEKRTERSPVLFAKERNILAFFSVLLKRTEHSLHSFPFFRKERKRTERSFGFHKSPKTREKNGKERNVLFFERKRTERSERKRTECPTLVLKDQHQLVLKYQQATPLESAGMPL